MRLTFSYNRSSKPVVRIRARIVDELAESAVANCIEYDLRLAPWPPRGAGVGERDTAIGFSAVVSHEPQIEILAPGYREVSHRTVPNDRRCIRLPLAPGRLTRRVQPREIEGPLPGLEVRCRDDRQKCVALTIDARSPHDNERATGRQARNRPRLGVHRHFDESSRRKLRDRA